MHFYKFDYGFTIGMPMRLSDGGKRKICSTPFIYGNLSLRGTNLLLFVDAFYYYSGCVIRKRTQWQPHDLHTQ